MRVNLAYNQHHEPTNNIIGLQQQQQQQDDHPEQQQQQDSHKQQHQQHYQQDYNRQRYSNTNKHFVNSSIMITISNNNSNIHRSRFFIVSLIFIIVSYVFEMKGKA